MMKQSVQLAADRLQPSGEQWERAGGKTDKTEGEQQKGAKGTVKEK